MIRLTLIGLVVFGLWNGGRLSYSHFQTGEACPILGVVPACYIAFIGYLAMALALAGTTAKKPELNLSWLFWSGLLAAGGLALVGSTLEVIKGDVCPRAGNIPMCYISLAMSITIGGLFWGTMKS